MGTQTAAAWMGHSVHEASARHLLRFLNRLAGYESVKRVFTAATTFSTVRSTSSGIVHPVCRMVEGENGPRQGDIGRPRQGRRGRGHKPRAACSTFSVSHVAAHHHYHRPCSVPPKVRRSLITGSAALMLGGTEPRAAMCCWRTLPPARRVSTKLIWMRRCCRRARMCMSGGTTAFDIL